MCRSAMPIVLWGNCIVAALVMGARYHGEAMVVSIRSIELRQQDSVEFWVC